MTIDVDLAMLRAYAQSVVDYDDARKAQKEANERLIQAKAATAAARTVRHELAGQFSDERWVHDTDEADALLARHVLESLGTPNDT